MNNNLLKYCKNTTNRDDFVGIRFTFDDVESIYYPEINFPYGYYYTENTLHNDILCLIKVLTNAQKKLEKIDLGHHAYEVQGFPVHSYMVIIQDYLQNGYYQEREVIYATRTHGKVNWGRTIKKERPILQDNGAIYLNLQTRLHRNHDEHILTEISKHCVFESFSKFGWFYGIKNPGCPSSHFNQSIFINILKNKLHNSNKDMDKQLFQSMINVLSNMDNYSQSNQSFVFGTTRFESVWEYLIEYTFGTENEDIKQRYYPKAQWHINGKKPIDSSNLRPDTIMFDRENRKLYVIDAKYYRYGIIKDILTSTNNLPATSDITKQVLYAHFIATKSIENIESNYIRNVFIMPFNAQQNNSSIYQYVGYAHLEWFTKGENAGEEYTKIYTILMDTKHLMNNLVSKNLHEIKKLSCIIEFQLNNLQMQNR